MSLKIALKMWDNSKVEDEIRQMGELGKHDVFR